MRQLHYFSFPDSLRPLIFLFLANFFVFFSASAQQNYFNVPSSEFTEKNKIFFQQQFNFFRESTVSNTTFCAGVSHGFELGFNLLGITYQNNGFSKSPEGNQPVYPSLGLNFQGKLLEKGKYQLSLGGQILFPSKIADYECYFYLNQRMIFEKTRLTFGIFNGNNCYFDDEPRLFYSLLFPGIQIGAEHEIVREKLFFQVEYISGKTALSNLIPGFAWKINKKIILSSGFQIPNNKKTSSTGVIFEFTYIQ